MAVIPKNCQFLSQSFACCLAVTAVLLLTESVSAQLHSESLDALAQSINQTEAPNSGRAALEDAVDSAPESTGRESAAEKAEQIADSANDTEAANAVADAAADEEEDDLDALLDLADEDVQQLAQVRVQPVQRQQAAAPVAAEQFTPTPSLRTQVTSVTRQATSVGRTPAAVSVITSDMIRRSGARTIPDVLRLIPGVQVARIDANKWAISIRGFNRRFANKLLVQIDGRPVYSPLFGGTYWDIQDVVLEDIERIELVRGPGATVWGANAVNGVINITTKHTKDTTGLYAEGGFGTEERGFATLRYGEQVTDDFSYRIYGKWFDRDEGFSDVGAHDDWRNARGGFRTDWQATDRDQVTVQGDFYRGQSGDRSQVPSLVAPFSQLIDGDQETHGGNVLLRWSRKISDDRGWDVQTYYDRTDRFAKGINLNEDRKTFDIDFQYRFRVGDYHRLIWGARYRNTKDVIRNADLGIGFTRPERVDDLFSYFIQDEIQLFDRLYLTLGSKFSHDDYTGFEFQPTAKLLWAASDQYSLWGSVSRAVRSPSRALDDLRAVAAPFPGIPPGAFPQVRGNRASSAENLLAWEAGVRGQPNEYLSWDLAAFYNRYDDFVGQTIGAPVFDPSIPAAVLPLTFNNEDTAKTYGFECMAGAKLSDRWRVYGAYSFLRILLDQGTAIEGRSPRNQIYLQSSFDLGKNWEYDVAWRYVDTLRNQNIPSYNVMDMRLAWSPSRRFEFAVVGRNLLDKSHPEFEVDPFTGNLTTEVQREVYGLFTIRR